MAAKFVEAYDTRTGKKSRVPEHWLGLFPHLSLTPKGKNRQTQDTPKPTPTPTPAPAPKEK